MVTVIKSKENRRRKGILINLFSLVLNTVTEQSWKYLGLGSYIKGTLEKCQQLAFFQTPYFILCCTSLSTAKKQQQDFIKPICKMLVLHDE